jgi:hypothetical protein
MVPSHCSLPLGLIIIRALPALNGMLLKALLKFFLFPFSFANNLDLCGPVTGHPCPGSPPFSPPPPFVPPPPVSTPGNLSLILCLKLRSADHALTL